MEQGRIAQEEQKMGWDGVSEMGWVGWYQMEWDGTG